MSDEPKIIVDDDWKSQAQAEKQRLAEEAEQAKAEGGAGSVPEKLEFLDLVRMFAQQAMMYLGAIPEPESGRAVVSLPIAKMQIDLLGILEEKTKGNLSDDETALLSGVLQDLRMTFVEVSKAVDQAVAEGKLKPGAGGGAGGP
ncbi:MAG: DUF1844 domain-containing protein, partial [Planctomycetota bacterium]